MQMHCDVKNFTLGRKLKFCQGVRSAPRSDDAKYGQRGLGLKVNGTIYQSTIENSSELIVLTQLMTSRKFQSGWYLKKTFCIIFSLCFQLAILFDRRVRENFTSLTKQIIEKALTYVLNQIRDFAKNLVVNPRCTV